MNTRFFRAACAVLTASLLVPAALRASSSGGAMSIPIAPQQQLTPEQQANSLYNDGISYRDKAEKLEKQAASETDSKKKEKLEAKARDRHLDSIKKFAEATKKSPSHYSAWGNLGYAYRKTGDYTSSLDAYQKALDIQPNYTPAIEYRAEAYLALNRLDEVRSVYMALFSMDRPRADELAAAIDKWIEKKKTDPSGVEPAKLEEFAQWAAQRKQLASQVSSVLKPNGRW